MQQAHAEAQDEIIQLRDTVRALRGELESLQASKQDAVQKTHADSAGEIGDLNHFREGRKHYRAGDWDRAIRAFRECLKANEHDELSDVYIERCELLKAAPPADWDGVWRMTSK